MSNEIEHPFEKWWAQKLLTLPRPFVPKDLAKAAWDDGYRLGFDQGYKEAEWTSF